MKQSKSFQNAETKRNSQCLLYIEGFREFDERWEVQKKLQVRNSEYAQLSKISMCQTPKISVREIFRRELALAERLSDIYISNHYFINQLVNMKRAEKSTPTATKKPYIYKYELKDTNEVFKQAAEYCPPSVHSTAQSNKLKQSPAQFEEDDYLHDAYSAKDDLFGICFEESQKSKIIQDPINFAAKQSIQGQFQENLIEKKKDYSQFYKQQKRENSKKQEGIDIDNFNSSHCCGISEKNQDPDFKKINSMKAHSPENSIEKDYTEQMQKDLKKSKKGLANISLKVKNIVTRCKQLTYKQVSDAVLQQSKSELPKDDEMAHQKQIKNIRRRVYDALNVMVSVQILGKKNRQVVLTESTEMQGKRLTSSYPNIAEKKEKLMKLRESCRDKEKSLNLLLQHYESVSALRKRNQQFLNESESKDIHEGSNVSHPSKTKSAETPKQKFMFPLIFFVPSNNKDQKTNVEIQCVPEPQNHENMIRKVRITGKNIQMFTDANAVKDLDLAEFKQQQTKFISEIKQLLEDRIEVEDSSSKSMYPSERSEKIEQSLQKVDEDEQFNNNQDFYCGD